MKRLVKVVVALGAVIACDRLQNANFTPTDIQPTGTVAAATPVFTEDFESDSLSQWQDGVDPERHKIVNEPGRAKSGSRYLSVTYPAGRDGGWITRFFMPGYEALRASLWVRFPKDWVGGTKIIGLYGSRIDDQWSAFGKAGVCPKGTDFFDAMLITQESGNPGPLKFYTYYPAMFRDNDGVTCWGRYGDKEMRTVSYSAASSSGMSQETWHHIEFEVRLNKPGQSDGSQKFWVDGVLGASWNGISFRDSDVLRLNAAQLSFSSGATGVARAQTLDIDDIFVGRID
jgi:polysaccharide lyase-like protein